MEVCDAEQLELLKKFKTDFLHYAPRALQIRSKAGTVEKLVLNKAQMHVHSRIEEQKRRTGKVRAIVLKGRQQGMSTYIGARFYHRSTFEFGKRVLILTHEQASTDALFEMTKRYHEHCPLALRQPTSAASAKELLFSELDSGYIVATAGSKAVGRGRTIQYFHGSEAAFWPNAEDHMAGLGQAIPDLPGTEIILESTANGVGNLFYNMWRDAEQGVGDYIAIFVPWYDQEEYRRHVPLDFVLESDEIDYADRYKLDNEQMAWRRLKITDDFRGDVSLFDQEYPACPALAFRRVSGNPLISPELVTAARIIKQYPVEAIGPKIMGVDPAEYGNDSTAIVIRQGRKVFPVTRHQKRGPMEVAGLVAIMADKEKPDAINVDCTGVGSGVADRLIELGYPVNRVHFGERAIDTTVYGRRRDEMWGELRKYLEDAPCELPQDDALEADLCSPQYTYDSSRRLVLESKEKMRERGVRSPDSGDALALTFAVPFAGHQEKPRAFRAERSGAGREYKTRDWRT